MECRGRAIPISDLANSFVPHPSLIPHLIPIAITLTASVVPLQEFHADPTLHLSLHAAPPAHATSSSFQGRTCIDCRQLMARPGATAAQWCKLEAADEVGGVTECG